MLSGRYCLKLLFGMVSQMSTSNYFPRMQTLFGALQLSTKPACLLPSLFPPPPPPFLQILYITFLSDGMEVTVLY